VSDNDLIQSALTGNQCSYTKLFKIHYDTVFWIAYRYFSNTDDAKDVTQETFIKAFANLPNFDTSKKFSTWLGHIVTNARIDWHIKHQGKIIQRTAKTEEETTMTISSFCFYPSTV